MKFHLFLHLFFLLLWLAFTTFVMYLILKPRGSRYLRMCFLFLRQWTEIFLRNVDFRFVLLLTVVRFFNMIEFNEVFYCKLVMSSEKSVSTNTSCLSFISKDFTKYYNTSVPAPLCMFTTNYNWFLCTKFKCGRAFHFLKTICYLIFCL